MDVYQSYIVLGHNLENFDCEWEVCTGVDAEREAHARAKKLLGKKGKWHVQIRPVSPPIYIQDARTNKGVKQ